MLDALLYDLEDLIETEVRGGFTSRGEIIELVVDFLLDVTDYNPDLLIEKATEWTDLHLRQHHIEQATWLHVTDCDRLDEAFAELDRAGIVARHNFTCCQTCGHAEIGFEIDDTECHRPVYGYVFYHQQDTENAVACGDLHLAYGAVDGTESASVEIAYAVVDTLRRHGLDVQWNGMIQKRIRVSNLIWQWRR